MEAFIGIHKITKIWKKGSQKVNTGSFVHISEVIVTDSDST